MKRSLILLLVVALLATMVPTIALAADATTPLVKSLDTFMVAMPDITGMLSRAKKTDTNQFVLQLTGTQNTISKVSATGGKTGEAAAVNSSAVKVVWTTSDRNIAGFNIEASKKDKELNIVAEGNDHGTITQILDADGNTKFPVIDGRAVGDVVFTGKAYWADANLNRNPTLLGTVSFNVHILPVWETKVTIKDFADEYKEKETQTHEYWLVDKKQAKGDILSISEITGGEAYLNLEELATVYNDPDQPTGNPNDWAATYGVGELTWTTTDESIAKVDKHGRVWFSGKTGKVTIRATAKEETKYPHTPKYAEVTFIIYDKPVKEQTSYEAFKKVEFTADDLGVKRGCSSNYVNIARFLELYPRPVEWYQQKGGDEHQDGQGGNYGVNDDIIWTSLDENVMWICKDKSHYTNGIGPNWQECYVEVAENAKAGQKVTIRATSKQNPALYDDIVLYVVANDKISASFERTALTLRVGESDILKILGTESDLAKLDDDYYTLTSENTNIAEVNGVYGYFDGSKEQYYVWVKGVAPGKTKITLQSARYQLSISADVTVVAAEGVKSVTVPEKYQNITMPLYDVDSRAEVFDGVNTVNVNVDVNPDDAWYKATWTSSDPSVAYVVYDGDTNLTDSKNAVTIRAAGVGKCKITVTIDDGNKVFKRSMNITVVKAKATKLALNVNKATVYLHKGGDNTLQLTATDKKTDEAVPVTWTSSDKTIAKVSKTGLVTFKKEGTVKITAATKDGYKAEKTCTIKVKKLPVSKIVVDSKKMTMKVGETSFVQYRVNAKAYNQAVSFKSSDKKVVKVDKYGNLEALKAGKAEITITAKDGSGVTAKVIITVKGVAENTDIDVVEVVEDEGLELTLDGIDGIEDLGIEDEVVLDNNEVIELAID